MNIKVRLALQFTFIIGGILLFFSILIYYFSYSNQISKFRQNLLDSAKNSATLLINVAEVDSSLLMKIHESTIFWEKEELVLTDTAFKVIYTYNSQYLDDKDILTENARDDLNYFTVTGKEGVFYRHIFGDHSYFVYAMAFDASRVNNLRELRKFLAWSIIFSICLSILLSYFFAKRAMRPISRIISGMKEINSLKLNTRLDEGNRRDEIAQLAITFNEMLSNLEIAFRSQKEFVSNASHELRTPLTVMIGESEYVLNHTKSPEQYARHISRLISDLKSMNTLINSLLELAQIGRDKEIVFSDMRLDEAVFSSIQKIMEKYPERKIIPKIHYPENGVELIIKGNPGLLEIAFKNLIDNACKFSDKDVVVEFDINDSYVKVLVSDSGIGIPENEISRINEPFRRASNVKFIGGYGIGLSLVWRIIELHHADLIVHSRINEGSSFEMKFNRSS